MHASLETHSLSGCSPGERSGKHAGCSCVCAQVCAPATPSTYSKWKRAISVSKDETLQIAILVYSRQCAFIDHLW